MYNQQVSTLYNIPYYCQCSTCFSGFSARHEELKNCTHSIGYMLCVQFLSSSWWAEKSLKHAEHWQ